MRRKIIKQGLGGHTVFLPINWVRNNLSDKIVIKYRYNPNLLGGAVIVSGGEYKNISIAKLIDTFFDANRKQVSELISQNN